MAEGEIFFRRGSPSVENVSERPGSRRRKPILPAAQIAVIKRLTMHPSKLVVDQRQQEQPPPGEFREACLTIDRDCRRIALVYRQDQLAAPTTVC